MCKWQSALLSYLVRWIQLMFYVGLIMCMNAIIYGCNRGIEEILIFFVFQFHICNGQGLLYVTNIVAQVTGTSRLVMSLSQCPLPILL
jgi:hypothetical protein